MRSPGYVGRPWVGAADRGPQAPPAAVPLSTAAVTATTTADGDEEFSCPECSKEFKSARGAAMHLRKVHES